MKKIMSISVLLLALFTACTGGGNQHGNSNMGGTTADKGIEVPKEMLATTKDLVCGMSLETIADTAVVNGKVYPFCAKECKDEFKAHPEKYVIN